MQASLEKLRKYCRLEREKSYDNKRVMGGLVTVLSWWEGEARNEGVPEEFIQGTEVTGAVLGNTDPRALPLVEIVPDSTYAFFDYEAKYQPGASREICPAISRAWVGSLQ